MGCSPQSRCFGITPGSVWNTGRPWWPWWPQLWRVAGPLAMKDTEHLFSCVTRGESGAKDHRACCCTVVCLCNLLAAHLSSCARWLEHLSPFCLHLSGGGGGGGGCGGPALSVPLAHVTAMGRLQGPWARSLSPVPCPLACLLCLTHRTGTAVSTTSAGREGSDIKRRDTHDPTSIGDAPPLHMRVDPL